MRAMPVPALNKWTKVAPAIGQVTLMSHFCGILAEAFACHWRLAPALAEPRTITAEDDTGEPLDQAKTWRELARKRTAKATHFMSDPECRWRCLLWLAASGPVMGLHFQLFKHATWLSERPPEHQADRLHSVDGLFCGDGNVASTACAALADMVAGVGPLADLQATDEEQPWSQARLRTVRRVALLAIGELWRKLVEPWDRYPWLLASVFDLDAPLQEREASADRFLRARPCCLDAGLGRRLRAAVHHRADLFDEELVSAMRAAFDRVVVTSTWVERLFARFRAWTSVDRQTVSLAGLASRQHTSLWRTWVEAWRLKQGVARPSHKRRPSWVHSEGPRSTGLHLFMREGRPSRSASATSEPAALGGVASLDRGLAAWRALSAEERQAWAQRALQVRSVDCVTTGRHRLQPALPERGGPWGSAPLEGWPLAPDELEGYLASMDGVAKAATAWTEAHGSSAWGGRLRA